MRRKTFFLFQVIIFLLPFFAEGQTWQWVKRIGTQYVSDISTDNAGNTLLTGLLTSINIIGSTTLTANSGSTYVTKIDANGNVLWAINGGVDTRALAISYDAATGGSYLLGAYNSTATVSFGPYTIAGTAFDSYYLTKLDANGNFLWAKKINGSVTSGSLKGDVKADNNGNVYVTGAFSGNLIIGTPQLTSSGITDMFVAKFDSNGNVLWVRKGGGALNETGNSITVDYSGNCYVAGDMAYGTMYFGNLSATINNNSNSIFVVKYDSFGTEQYLNTASALSANCGQISAKAIEVDNSSNVYITGTFNGTASFPATLTSYTNASACNNSDDVFTAKYNSFGQCTWARKGGSGQNNELGSAIAVTPGHEALVVGDFYTIGVFGSSSVVSNTLTLKPNAFMVKYNPGGTENMLIQNGNSGSSTRAMGIGFDGSQNMYMTGTHIGTGTFGSQSVTYNEVDSCVYLTKITNIISPTDVVASISQISGNNPMCSGSVATFSASVINGGSSPTYQWYINGSPVGTNTPTFSSGSLANNNSVSCVVTSDMPGATNNPATSEPIIMNVGNINVSIVSPTICAGGSATLSPYVQYSPLTYQWSNGATTPSIVISPTVNSVYTVTLNFAGGCFKTATSSATVYTAPNLTVSAPSSSLCPKVPLTLTASGANTYSWTNGPTGFTYNTISPTVTTVYTVTGTDNNGCIRTGLKTVSIYSFTPITPVATATSICRSQSVGLSASGATSYTYSGYGASSITVTPTSTTIYTVSTKDANNCNITNTVSVNVDNSAFFNLSATAYTVCAGNNDILSASNSTNTYVWMPGSLTGSVVTVAPTANTIYTVTGTSSSCSYTNSLSVYTKPAATVSITSNGTLTCVQQPTLYASSSPSVTYAWYYKNGATLYSAGSTTNNVVAYLAFPYYCLVTYTPNSCVTTSSISFVIDNANPSLTYTAPSMCTGASATLNVGGAASYNLNYTGYTNNVAFVLSPTVTTTYTLVGVGSNSCTSVIHPQLIVNSNPTVSISGAGLICQGNTISLSASGATSYTWSTGSNNTTVNDSPVATTVYSVMGSDINNCTGTATTQVMVNPSPAIIVNDGLICEGESYTITPSGALSYTYSGGSDIVTPVTTTDYTVTGENGNGCIGTATMQVAVNPAPVILVSSNSSVCEGSSTNITASGATTYSWSTGATTPTIAVTPTVTETYSVTGTDLNNCSTTQTVSITVDNTCQDVWPGDVNSDGTADNLDVLELGLHYSQTGPARATTSNSWQSYVATNWSGTITNGKNLNHSDCNGDGTINDDDTLAIYNNYGLTHVFRPVQQTTVNLQISIVPDQPAVVKGSWGTASVYLGDAANPVPNINGVAFTVNFDKTLIETNSVWIEYPTSFINASNQNLHFRKLDFAGNNLYTATTHTIANNISGNGLIAILHYQIKSSLVTDEVLNLGIVQANKSDASGTIVPLTSGTGTLMAIGVSVGINELSGNLIGINPNPAQSSIFINSTTDLEKVEVVSLTGQVLISELADGKTQRVNTEALANGVYFVKVYNSSKQTVLKKLVIQK